MTEPKIALCQWGPDPCYYTVLKLGCLLHPCVCTFPSCCTSISPAAQGDRESQGFLHNRLPVHRCPRTGNATAPYATAGTGLSPHVPWAIAPVLCLCKGCFHFCSFGVLSYSSTASRGRAYGERRGMQRACFVTH